MEGEGDGHADRERGAAGPSSATGRGEEGEAGCRPLAAARWLLQQAAEPPNWGSMDAATDGEAARNVHLRQQIRQVADLKLGF